jgi:hypothetical protein
MSKSKVDRADYEALERELRVYRETIDSQDASVADRLKELSQQLLNQNKELDSRESELQKLRKRVLDAEKRAETREREVETLSREVESLREDLQSHRNGFDETFTERQDYMEKIRTKNTQIQNLLDEIREYELANKDLNEKVVTLKRELSDATSEVTKSSQDVTAINSRLHQIQTMNQSLLREKEQLMNEVESLQELIHKFKDEDERMANKFSAQVDRVIQMMNEKDIEISKLQKTIKLQLGRGTASDFETGKDMEMEIKLLKDQLDDAGKALHQQNQLVEYLQSESRKKVKQQPEIGSSESGEDVLLRKQIDHLEHELKAKDVIITDLRSRNHKYEREHYGLSDAVRELDSARSSLAHREKRISDLICQINHLAEELNDAQAELEYVRECAEIRGIDCNYESKEDRGDRNDKLTILRLQQHIIKLEEDRITAEDELRKMRSTASGEGASKATGELRSKIFLLETENADLRQGMREILVGVQESDGRSDVTIDCPSLERVCQLIESRSISDSLANVIALKAELDLLRGFNQQLRSELKRVRCEHLNVLSMYTEDVLLHSETDFEQGDISQLEASEGEILQLCDIIQELQPVMSSAAPEESAEEEEGDLVEKEDKRVEASAARTLSDNPNKEDEANADAAGDEECKPDDAENAADTMQAACESEDENTITIDVPLVVHGSKLDTATQTEAAPDPMPRGIKRHASPTPTSNRCFKCARFARTFKEIHNRLNRMESGIRSGEDFSLQRIQQLQDQHRLIVHDLEQRMAALTGTISRKDLLIQHLKEKAASNRRIPRRETFTITSSTTTDRTVALRDEEGESESQPAIEISRLQEDSSPDEERLRSTEIIENVIECLQQRITHKNNTIRDYQQLLEETKKSFEREINCMLDQKIVNREEDMKEYNLKAIVDSQELEQMLDKCLKELDDLKQEASSKVKELETIVHEKSKRITELEDEIESLQRKSAMNQNTLLRNQVNQLKDEVKSKEKTIANLTKNLKDERMLRIGTVTSSPSSSSAATAKKIRSQKEDEDREKEISRLKQEVDDQKRLMRENELSRWESEKKLKESIDSLITKLKEKTEEAEKLTKNIDRLKLLLTKRDRSKNQQHQQQPVKKKKSVTFSADQVPELHVQPASPSQEHELEQRDDDEEQGVECGIIDRRRRSYPCDEAEELSRSSQREKELKILLTESLEREKLSALRLTSQMQEVSVDQQLLQENAHLKVELRMAEFELNRRNSLQT